MNPISFILAIAGLWFIFWLGWTAREESIKRMLAEAEIGAPFFLLHFSMLGFMENAAFSATNHFQIINPAMREIEVWGRVVWHFWVRVHTRAMTEKEMDQFYYAIWRMMEERREQHEMGKCEGQAASGDCMAQNAPHDPMH